MKLKYLVPVLFITTAGFMLADSLNNPAQTNPTGAPAARCGSNAEPLTCSYCHTGGPNTIQPGWITSTIPSTGYVPGTTYTIIATASYVGRSTFGFEISPQNNSGTYLGICTVTDVVHTKLISGTSGRKYMTHQTAGITGSMDYHTWSFNWTAPAAGSGALTFYGAFLCANGNNAITGDITYKANLPVTEDITSGITTNLLNGSDFSIYPNPVSETFIISYKTDHSGKVEIKLVDMQGRLIAPLMTVNKPAGSYENFFKIPFNLNAGIYFVEIATETNHIVKRILVQQ